MIRKITLHHIFRRVDKICHAILLTIITVLCGFAWGMLYLVIFVKTDGMLSQDTYSQGVLTAMLGAMTIVFAIHVKECCQKRKGRW